MLTDVMVRQPVDSAKDEYEAGSASVNSSGRIRPWLPLAPEELAGTEYARHEVPGCTTPTRFGNFVNNPAFPERRDALQLTRVRIERGQEDALFAEVESLFSAASASHRKLGGHDPATFTLLSARCQSLGYDCEVTWGLTRNAVTPTGWSNDSGICDVEEVAVDDPALKDVYLRAGRALAGVEYQLVQARRLQSTMVIARLHGKAVGASGWFVQADIGRYWHIYVTPEARGQGVGSAMIRYIANHQLTQGLRALVICCNEGRALQLYERLGFARHSFQWEFVRT